MTCVALYGKRDYATRAWRDTALRIVLWRYVERRSRKDIARRCALSETSAAHYLRGLTLPLYTRTLLDVLADLGLHQPGARHLTAHAHARRQAEARRRIVAELLVALTSYDAGARRTLADRARLVMAETAEEALPPARRLVAARLRSLLAPEDWQKVAPEVAA